MFIYSVVHSIGLLRGGGVVTGENKKRDSSSSLGICQKL